MRIRAQMHPQQKTEDHCYLACAGGANEAELVLPRVLGHSGMLGQPRRNEQQAPTCGAALTVTASSTGPMTQQNAATFCGKLLLVGGRCWRCKRKHTVRSKDNPWVGESSPDKLRAALVLLGRVALTQSEIGPYSVCAGK